MRKCLLILAAVALGISLMRTPVRARREATFGYPYSRVWTSAVRLMRVDFEANITEKDKDDGYFLFEYRERGKVYSGSMELMAVHATGQAEGESVRVVLTIAALPSYVENMIVDRLGRKLEQEFGPPRQAKRPGDAGSNRDRDDTDAPSDTAKPKPGSNPRAKPDADKSASPDDGE